MGYLLFFFRKNNFFVSINTSLETYFSYERKALLIEFFSITTGIYITMLSILAISATKIMEALLKKKIEQQLLQIMMWGLISSIFVVLALGFIPEMQGENIILFAVSIWAILHLIYFFFVLFVIFKFNVQNMDKEIDEENRWKRDIVKKMAIIQSDIEEIVKKIKK